MGLALRGLNLFRDSESQKDIFIQNRKEINLQNWKEIFLLRFVSGGCDSLVKIWREGEDGRWVEEAKLEAHSDWVRDTAWAPR